MTTNRKGHPRCSKCFGKGLLSTPRGWIPCTCVKGRRISPTLVELANTPLPDFTAWFDADRAARGLPPFQPEVSNDG